VFRRLATVEPNGTRMLTHRAARLATTVLAVCLRACSGPTQAAALNPPCQLSVPCPVAGQQCVDNAFLNRRVCSCPTGSGYLAGENCRASCPIVDTSKFQGSLPRPRDAADCATRPSAAWPCSRSPPRPSMNLASLLLLSSDPTLWATSFGLTRSRLRRGAGAQACSATPRAIIQRASATTRQASANVQQASWAPTAPVFARRAARGTDGAFWAQTKKERASATWDTAQVITRRLPLQLQAADSNASLSPLGASDYMHCPDDCSKICPAMRDGRECSGNGICTDKLECVCRPGFRGADCSVECPGGSHFACSGHGVCSAAAKCTCEWGYAGDRCQHRCPHLHGLPCGCASANALGLIPIGSRSCACACLMRADTLAPPPWRIFKNKHSLFINRKE
jgi:hypothetical protein